jgi:hypothetical protein
MALANAVCIDDGLDRFCFADSNKLNWVFELKELKISAFDFSKNSN